jgi:UPF0716 protein FxsA
MPISYFIVLFVGLPILELVVLLKVHETFHFWPTFLLVILTGVVGIALVKRQGISILKKIQSETANGNLPAPQMMDGVMILLAGAFLITPGLITDTAGFLLLIPFIRQKIRFWMKRKLEEKIRNGEIQVNIHSSKNLP